MNLSILLGRSGRKMPSVAHKLTRFAGSRRVQALLALLFPTVIACESGPHARDGSVPQTQKVAEISVRLDMSILGAPALSALAFRADVTDFSSGDVLGVVDPLVAPAPESGCELRDVAGQARALRAQGGTVSLEELSGVSVLTDASGPALEISPRVYPYADVVGGVIAEAGPVDIAKLPESLTIELPGAGDRPSKFFWAVPAAPRVLAQDQSPILAGTQVDGSGDLVLLVTGPQRTFLELRPYGAPVAVACATGSGGLVVVPKSLLTRMTAAAGKVPVLLDAVFRESRMVMAATPRTRVTVEARSSTVVDLRP
jgi:hypothetical protein